MANESSMSFFKKIDEKLVNNEIKLMLWNPKMDLIAIAFMNGDVHLYRMSWQKVWSINNSQQNVTITSMAWRPDGKILAVSYTNGHLRLLGVEDAKKIFSFNCNEAIQCLYWLQESPELTQKHETHNFYEDLSSRILPKPITYDVIYHLFEKSTNREFPDNLYLKDIKNLTYLVCTHGTSIAIFVYGYFLLIDINLIDLLSTPFVINYKQLNACYLSDNCKLLCSLGVINDNSNTYQLIYKLFDTKILHENNIQIKLISNKFGILFSMLTSLKTCIKEMEELWEDILVEMDQKFQLYALEKYNTNKINNGNGAVKVKSELVESGNPEASSLVHDFLQLYALGTCSDHFKTFLIHELTEKGLKKLETSVENYYSNIQRLICGNFQQISLCMFYHINELLGMTKWFDKFSIFSLTEQRVNEVLHHCASLMLKAQELNFVIDQNMKEIKLFFKWLHASIIHLTDDQAVTEISRLNEEMENLILDFINNTFKDDQTINLEKVGQYLKQENLRIQVTEDNDWQQFIKQNLSPKESEQLYSVKREKSLIGCFDEFKQSLNDCFKCQAISSTQPFKFIKQYNIYKFYSIKEANEMIASYKCFDDCIVTALLMNKSSSDCYILKHSINSDIDVKVSIVSFASQIIEMSQLNLQDVYVYDQDNVTLLGTDSKTGSNTYLIQLSLEKSADDTSNGSESQLMNIENDSFQNINENLMYQSKSTTVKPERIVTNAIVKCLNNTKNIILSASNSRRVAALLSSSRKRVKLFELEVDEDDEDEEDTGEEANVNNAKTTNDIKSSILNETNREEKVTNLTLNNSIQQQQQQKFSEITTATPINLIKTTTSSIISSIAPTSSIAPGLNLTSTVTPITTTTTDLNERYQQLQDRLRAKRKKEFEDEDDDTIEFNITNNTDIAASNTVDSITAAIRPNDTNNSSISQIILISNQTGNESDLRGSNSMDISNTYDSSS